MDEIEKYANYLNASGEVLSWIKTTGKKAIQKKLTNESDIEHVIDFLVSESAPTRLQRMSFLDAKRKADEWTKANQKKGRGFVDTDNDIKVIHDFLDGTKIVRLKTKKALEREGFLMSHCVGGYNIDTEGQDIYSYRDNKNMPHATFEVRKSGGEIVQIKGKGNGPIHPKYIHPILAFLKSIDISIRPNDMANLGYHHIYKDHIEFLKGIDGAWEQVIMISGEAYAHD